MAAPQVVSMCVGKQRRIKSLHVALSVRTERGPAHSLDTLLTARCGQR